jgi:hypothetical protein
LHFPRRGNHIIDFFGENIRREVVGHAFSFGTVESWSHGCVHPPSSGVWVHEVDAHGKSVGQAHLVSEGGTNCWWFLTVHDFWPAVHDPVNGS